MLITKIVNKIKISLLLKIFFHFKRIFMNMTLIYLLPFCHLIKNKYICGKQ